MAEDAPAPSEPVTVDVRGIQGGQIVVGSAVAGVIGVVSIAAAITGDVSGGTGVRVAVFVVALPFALVGILPLLMWRAVLRPRRLVLDADGMRWDDPDGIPWTVRWSELAGVTFAYPGADTGSPGRTSAIDLLLHPADPDFRDAHSEMGHLAEETDDGEVVYRLPFGHAHKVIGPIDRGLSSFAPALYHRDGPQVPPVHGRPWAVGVSVGLLALYWVAALATPFAIEGTVDLEGVLQFAAMATFWSVVVGLWLWRIWVGGPLAIGRMAQLATILGVLFLVGAALLGVIAFDLLRQQGITELWVLLPGWLGGAAMLTAGRLLARDDVRDWSQARGQGR